MQKPAFAPPWYLRHGLAMTLYTGLWAPRTWQAQIEDPAIVYQTHVFQGYGGVPLFAWMHQPPQPRATLIATYGITGSLDSQWQLQILARKAAARNYAVILFDWRAHGETARLSPTLTSDGLYEGDDFLCIAEQAEALGYPPPFWLSGYSLGGQLALWGIFKGESRARIGGGAVICPNLDAGRSLPYLMRSPLGRFLEQAIARDLKRLAQQISTYHPGALDPAAIQRATSIWGFDQELVIPRLGFASVEAYYAASSPLPWLNRLKKPTLLIYAADDPMFEPGLISDLQTCAAGNPHLDLLLTPQGGHAGYFNGPPHQGQRADPDRWWAWNRVLDWLDHQTD
jgi:hypothetical protein